MPNDPFAIPHINVTSVRPVQLPDINKSLASLMQMQMQQQRMALAAARVASRGGGGKSDLGKAVEVAVPTKDGLVLKKVYGHTIKERQAAAEQAIAEGVNTVIKGDAALQKDLAQFDSMSLPAQKEALERVRQTHGPRLAQLTGLPGEKIIKEMTTGLEQSIAQRQKAIDNAGIGTQLVTAGKQIFRNLRDAIGSIGETPAQQLARGKRAAEEQAQDIKENPYLDELSRLQQEKLGTAGFELSNFGKAAVAHGAGLAAMIAPAIVGAALAGPVGGAIGGAIGAGLPARGEALQQVATDDKLSEKKKEETIGQTAALSGLAAGVIGVIPGPANFLRPALTRRVLTKAIAKNGTPTAVTEGMLRDATAAETQAATKAWIDRQVGTALKPGSYNPTLMQNIGLHGVNAAALGGAFQIGSNAAYGMGTGLNVPLTRGLGEAVISGAVLGLPFGVGGRAASFFRGRPAGVDYKAPVDLSGVEGSKTFNYPRYDAPVQAPPTGSWENPDLARLSNRVSLERPPNRPPAEPYAPFVADPMIRHGAWEQTYRTPDLYDEARFNRPPNLSQPESYFTRKPETVEGGTWENPYVAQPRQYRNAQENQQVSPVVGAPENQRVSPVVDAPENQRVSPIEQARKFFATKPSSNQVADYIDKNWNGREDGLSTADVEQLRNEYYNPNKKAQSKIYKGIDRTFQYRNAIAEWEQYDNPARLDNTSQPTPTVGADEQVGAGGLDRTNPPLDSAVSDNPAPVVTAAPDATPTQTAGSNATAKRRRNARTATQNTGSIEETPAVINEQGIVRSESPDGESSVGTTALADAAGDTGGREFEPPAIQRAGDVSNAKQVGGSNLGQSRFRAIPLGADEQPQSRFRAIPLGANEQPQSSKAIPLGPTLERPAPDATPQDVHAIDRENLAETPNQYRINATDSDQVVYDKLVKQLGDALQGTQNQARVADLAAINLALAKTIADARSVSPAEILKNVIFSFNKNLDEQVRENLRRILSFNQEAWHGTPFEDFIDQLSTAYLGSGEGAQVHGWGLYVALSEQVAKENYQHELSANIKRKSLKGHPLENLSEFSSHQDVINFINRKLPYGVADFINPAQLSNDIVYVIKNFDFKHAKRWFGELEEASEFPVAELGDAIFDAVEKRFPDLAAWEKANPRNKGQRLRVDIPEDNVMLREEAIFKDQPEIVKRGIMKAIDELIKYRSEFKGDIKKFKSSIIDIIPQIIAYTEKHPQSADSNTHWPDSDASYHAFNLLNEIFKKTGFETTSRWSSDVAREVFISGDEIFALLGLARRIANLADRQQTYVEKAETLEKFINSLEKNTPNVDNTPILGELLDFKNGRGNTVNYPGGEIYDMLSDAIALEGKNAGDKQASLLLDKHGVKGIRYRGKRDGECAVIFNGDYIQILDRFYDQTGGRGRTDFLSDGMTHILFSNAADSSTPIHEFEHLYLEQASQSLRDNLVTSESKRAQIEKDLTELARWATKSDKDAIAPSWDTRTWSIETHEKIAKAFEEYFREGKAPTKEMEGIFARMKQLLMQLYQKAKMLISGNRLPKNIREVFDRQLTGYKEGETQAKSQVTSTPRRPSRKLQEAVQIETSKAKLTSEAQEKILSNETNTKETQEVINSSPEKWQKESLETAQTLANELKSLPDNFKKMSKDESARAKKLIVSEARLALSAENAPERFLDDVVKNGQWKEIKDALILVGAKLPEKAEKLLDELLPKKETKKPTPEEVVVEEKPFTEKTYNITLKNINKKLTSGLKKAGWTDEQIKSRKKLEMWLDIRDELRNNPEYDRALDDKLTRMSAYVDERNRKDLDFVDDNIRQTLQVVSDAIKNPTPEKVQAATEAVNKRGEEIQKLRPAQRKKLQDAKVVLEEHAKPENEPPAKEYNELKDEAVIKDEQETREFISPEDLATIQLRLWELANNESKTLQSLVGEKKFGKGKTTEQLVRDMTELYRKYWERDPALTKSEKNTYDKMKHWLAINGVYEMPREKGAYPLDYNDQVHNNFVDLLKVSDELAAEQAEAMRQTSTPPEILSNGVYKKELSGLKRSIGAKFDKIFPGKEKTQDAMDAVVYTMIKQATGGKLTPNEKKLYDKVTSAGVKSLTINKTAIEQSVKRDKSMGYEDANPVEEVTANPAGSMDKLTDQTKKGC